jgi:hypothetical protein
LIGLVTTIALQEIYYQYLLFWTISYSKCIGKIVL